MRSIIYFLLVAAFLSLLINFFTSNWITLTSAPLAFTLCLGIGGILGWLIRTWSYKERNETQEIRLKAYEEEIKRLGANNTELIAENAHLKAENAELKNQLQSQPTLPPKLSPEPSSVVKVSEVHQEPPKLLSAEAPTNKPSQDELKTQAQKMANEIYQLIDKAERDTKVSPTSAYPALTIATTGEDPYVSSARKYYNEKLHDSAVELKSKIRTPFEFAPFPSGKYTNPRTLQDLKDIALDLKKIASSARDFY